MLFEVDGFRFGKALCIEVNFPELFMEYTALGADCVLLSSSSAMSSGIVGPYGYWLDRCAVGDARGLACVDLDRTQPGLEFALKKAGPWRQSARTGEIYRARRVHDARSVDRTHF